MMKYNFRVSKEYYVELEIKADGQEEAEKKVEALINNVGFKDLDTLDEEGVEVLINDSWTEKYEEI